jgi:hypothetical protein
MIDVKSAIFKRGYLVAALSWATVACQSERGGAVEEVPPGITFEALRFRSYRAAVLVASGEAERAALRRDTTDLVAERISVRIPGRPGEPELLVEAPRGSGNLGQHLLQIEGGVQATRGRDVARTERASYAADLVTGDRPLAIRGADWDLDGPGFTLDTRTGAVRIGRGGKLTIRGGGR